MAYTHSKYEVEMIPRTPATGAGPTAAANGSNLTVTTAFAIWGPGYVPHLIRGAAIVPLVTTALTGGSVGIVFEADISAAGTPTKLFNINLPSSGGIHKALYYTPTYDIEIKPGHLVQARATTAATAGVYGKVILYVEPRWDTPANVTSMLKTT